jgi:hypothetical protein
MAEHALAAQVIDRPNTLAAERAIAVVPQATMVELFRDPTPAKES